MSSNVESERLWLQSVTPDPGKGEWTGFDATVGDDTTWILHAMYENPEIPLDITYNDLSRARLIERTPSPPSIVAEVQDLLQRLNQIGTSEEWSPDNQTDWSRLKWSDLLSRLGKSPTLQSLPGFRSFPYSGDWPARYAGPEEGRMDNVQFCRLLRIVRSEAGRDVNCFTAMARLETGSLDGAQEITPVTIDGLLDLHETAVEIDPQTPTNLWPADHSWFVWTDHDLMGTKVSGSRDLIDVLRNDPVLEAVHLDRRVSDVIKMRTQKVIEMRTETSFG
jgi:hypothetical protein